METNRKFWDRVAKLYTGIQQKSNAKMYNKIAEDIAHYFTKDKNVLELAMGTGQFTFALCDKVKHYEATDFSQKMLNEAKRIKPNGATYALQDATNLTYNDSSFDIVMIANALHIMPNPEKALAEIHRVLQPEGIAVLPTFVYEGKVNRFKLWIMKIAGFKVFNEWKVAEYSSFIEKAGFRIVETKLYPSKIGPECEIVAKKI